MECAMCKKNIPAIKVTICAEGAIGMCPGCGSVTLKGTIKKSEMDKIIWASMEEIGEE